jgi:hypothetical protein
MEPVRELYGHGRLELQRFCRGGPAGLAPPGFHFAAATRGDYRVTILGVISQVCRNLRSDALQVGAIPDR